MTIKLGLIGLGEVAQLIHLPILSRMAGRLELVAAYEASPSVARSVAARWNIGRLCDSAEELIGLRDLDAVMVLSPDAYHCRHGRAALTEGKHLFLEKPACLTVPDLEDLVAVAEASDRITMVGYMRRYAPAFQRAKSLLPEIGEITYVRVRDIICEGEWFAAQVDRVAAPQGDVPNDLIAEGRTLRSAMVDTATGGAPNPDVIAAYSVLTGLSSHSFSAMRDLLGGPPIRVIAATARQGGQQISVLFDYGSFVASYECLIGDVVRFEAGIEVNGRDKRMSFQYPTPYIRNLPMSLEFQTSGPDATRSEIFGPDYTDPFRCELEAFHQACLSGTPTMTGVADSLVDLRLFGEVIDKMKLS